MWSVLRCCFSVRGEQHSSVSVYATKAMDRGSRQSKKERIAVVEAWQNEWGDQFHCSLDGKILPDRTNSTERVVCLMSSPWTVCCRGERRGFWQNQREGLWYRQAEGCWRKWRTVFVVFQWALLLSFDYLVEVCFVSSSFWCPNNSLIIH